MKITIDRENCMGSGNCVYWAGVVPLRLTPAAPIANQDLTVAVAPPTPDLFER